MLAETRPEHPGASQTIGNIVAQQAARRVGDQVHGPVVASRAMTSSSVGLKWSGMYTAPVY